MSVQTRRAVDMLMTPAEYARAMAFIARKERKDKAAQLAAEKRLLQRLSRPALTPPKPYRAPGRPTVFFTHTWKTITAEVIEAMIEDDEVNDLVLGLEDPPAPHFMGWTDLDESARKITLASHARSTHRSQAKQNFRGRQYMKHAA